MHNQYKLNSRAVRKTGKARAAVLSSQRLSCASDSWPHIHTLLPQGKLRPTHLEDTTFGGNSPVWGSDDNSIALKLNLALPSLSQTSWQAPSPAQQNIWRHKLYEYPQILTNLITSHLRLKSASQDAAVGIDTHHVAPGAVSDLSSTMVWVTPPNHACWFSPHPLAVLPSATRRCTHASIRVCTYPDTLAPLTVKSSREMVVGCRGI